VLSALDWITTQMGSD